MATAPVPVPLAFAVTKAASAEAVHPHPAPAFTPMLTDPPAAPIDTAAVDVVIGQRMSRANSPLPNAPTISREPDTASEFTDMFSMPGRAVQWAPPSAVP